MFFNVEEFFNGEETNYKFATNSNSESRSASTQF